MAPAHPRAGRTARQLNDVTTVDIVGRVHRPKILHSSNFWSGARCAPGRTKAQRVAPIGSLGGSWLRFERFVVARHRRAYPELPAAVADAAVRDARRFCQ
jgi:hypothetical protein